MKLEKRADVVARLKEITREIERITMAPKTGPDLQSLQSLHEEQEELESFLESHGPDSLS